MLGRTDSRRRLLFLLVVFGVGSLALVTRTVYWQVLRGDELTARAAEQTSVRIEIGGRRGDIYDRTGTVLLATSVARDRLIAAADQLTPVQQAADGGHPGPPPGARRGRPRPTCAPGSPSGKPYVILARGHHPGDGRAHPPGGERQTGGRHLPGARAGARVPAGRRRPRIDPGRAPARLREPRERGPVRRRAVLPGGPGRRAARAPRAARRERPAQVGDLGRPGARASSARTCG